MRERYIKMESAGEWAERTLNSLKNGIVRFFANFDKTTADTFSWLAIVVLNCATIPSFLAMKAGINDKMPSLDLVALLWFGLLLYFVRSAILKDTLNVITIGFGFAVQALFLGFIFFQ